MEMKVLNEVIDCLSNGRRLAHYFEDRYAYYLLAKYCEKYSEASIAQIKQSSFSKLLQRPGIKQLVSNFGNGKVDTILLNNPLATDYTRYVITLSKWGMKKDYRWSQTTLPGANLVMQLNLTNQHDQYLRELKLNDSPFKYRAHPIHESKSSLSWARIDFSFETGEALVEEIQTDWIRRAARHFRWAKRTLGNGNTWYRHAGATYQAQDMFEYTRSLLDRYEKQWMEATLFHAIKLIKEDIGLSKIFYHSYQTGAVVKNITGTLPPKSLYTSLPRRFCFVPDAGGPDFVVRNSKFKRRLKKIKEPSWLKLEL
ncbi:hypothetical protein [Aliikangiella sp. G2MR2-5]|uniref:hypothetical protein n=1 Tax=Aliikangiella sp. G2MR2-5 TaxID=2788943 RepID=UPI0018AC375B|nr:hypothetical protein [Aliikangiella sp. G2MR2-5]